MITGKDIIDLGFAPGQWLKDGIATANEMEAAGASPVEILLRLKAVAPPPFVPLLPDGSLGFYVNIDAETPEEVANIEAVLGHMRALMRVPVVSAGAVMPDACPTDKVLGTIPVGGVVASSGIHPGFHSADICCSVAITILGDVDPAKVLDAGQKVTHFGPGGRRREACLRRPDDVKQAYAENRLLADLETDAVSHFGTQGDGNHFLYVGRLKSTGSVALVTHHGSRKPGAMLYKRGMAIAEKWRKRLSPETPPHSAWIPAEEPEGILYWAALQAVRLWTRESHFAIHDLVCSETGAKSEDRFWNEHNFVFKRDGLFYHGKGATPAWPDFSDDTNGLTLIPLNMAEPILIARGLDAKNGLGFSPHGAGRNYSRSAYLRGLGTQDPASVLFAQTKGIDARFFCGNPDISELPGAYKNAAAVRAQIKSYGLAEIADEVLPYGCIMAGEWDRDAPWKAKKRGMPRS